MANGWGGRRPGSGGVAKTDVVYFERKRDYVRMQVEPEFGAMVNAQITKAKNGDLDAFKYLCTWIAGQQLNKPDTTIDNSTTINQSLILGDLLPWWNATHQLQKEARQHAIGMVIDGTASPPPDPPNPDPS